MADSKERMGVEMDTIPATDKKNDETTPVEQDHLIDESLIADITPKGKDEESIDEGVGLNVDEYTDNTNASCCSYISEAQRLLSDFYTKHRSTIIKVLKVLAVMLYCAYFVAACYLDLQRATALMIFTAVLVGWLGFRCISMLAGDKLVSNVWMPMKKALKPKWCIIKWVATVAIVLIVIVLVAVVIGDRVNQYRGLFGLLFFIVALFLTSFNPAKVNWRPVLWGMLLNFTFAMIILKTQAGLSLFDVMAKQVTAFLAFSDVGAKFVFGTSTYTDHFFAFKILPTIVFFSCVISTLYYLGVMQFIIARIALVMQTTMGTSATESLSCAGNIFVGQTEAPILVRPFLADMTKSELHAVMTGGFATIAGGVLAAFIGFGIDAVHLIAASVMNAPMALAVSKLTYPETEKPKYVEGNKLKFAEPTEQNLVEAAAAGASQSIGLVANIAANLIAFLALLACVNAGLHGIGSLVDIPDLSFEMICSYVFWIVAYLMGVRAEDCGIVAELIGTKLVINEFVAYEKLGGIIENRATCTPPIISRKSEIISTYALCGFANLSSIGIQLGGIGAMAPSRRADLASLVIRAVLAGFVTTLMTATLAGILITDYTEEACVMNSTALNMTSIANITTALTGN